MAQVGGHLGNQDLYRTVVLTYWVAETVSYLDIIGRMVHCLDHRREYLCWWSLSCLETVGKQKPSTAHTVAHYGYPVSREVGQDSPQHLVLLVHCVGGVGHHHLQDS